MSQPLTTISFSLENIKNAAQQFWQQCSAYRILAFSGDMGAGKTTFIHALCDHLQVADTVSSPTFALINEYHFTDTTNNDRTIYHMDWYRLKDEAEAINAGIEDCLLRQEAYCFIEWPEKAPALLPHPHIWITIETTALQERKLKAVIAN